MQDRIRRDNEIGCKKAQAAPSLHSLSMSYDPREHKKKMAELDKKFNARERDLLAAAKATFSTKSIIDKGAVIQTVRKLKNNRLRVYYSYVGEQVNVTPTEQFGTLSVVFLWNGSPVFPSLPPGQVCAVAVQV